MARKQNERNKENVYPRGFEYSDRLEIKLPKTYKPHLSTIIKTPETITIIKQGKKKNDTRRKSNTW